VKWQIAERPSRLARKVPEGSPAHEKLRRAETLKAKMRALVEHPFHVLKCRFGHRKARYRGLPKNAQQLYVAFGLANLLLAGRRFSTA
jgi:IS5 family transposase